MGIDIGSYESKGVLTDLEGHVIAKAKAIRKHELEFVKWGMLSIMLKRYGGENLRIFSVFL